MMPSASRARVPAEVGRLASLHLDALRELANIGAGHAATALSQMTGRRVAIGVPTVSVAAHHALSEVLGDGALPVLLVRLTSADPFAGGLAVAFTETAAQELTDLLLGRASTPLDWLDQLGASAIKEVGNVLGAAYLNALARVTGWTITLSTPDLVYARADWAIQLLSVDHAVSDYAVCLETRFTVDGAPMPVQGHVLLFPMPGSVSAVLKAVGLD